MRRIAIYSRKSKFTGQGDSMENQIEMCKNYINNTMGNNNVEFTIYEDEGFSGGNMDRPEFKKMLTSAVKNEFDTLICYRLDRISRNVADFSNLVQKLQELNIDFISIKEQFDTSTPMGRAMMYISSVFAQLERETIAERVKDNMLEMAKNGKWTGGKVPLGFKLDKIETVDKFGLPQKKSSLIADEEDMLFVRFLYEKYLELGSLHKLETYTHENNIRSKSNILFEKSTLKIILQNPIYVKSSPDVVNYLTSNNWVVYGKADGVHSLLTYNKTENSLRNGKQIKVKKNIKERFASISTIKGYIDDDLWLKVQYQFDKNRDTFPRLGKTHNALLTGILKCGFCESNMLIQHGNKSKTTGEKLFYYVCSLKRKSKRKLCNNKNASALYIESLVIKSLHMLALNKQTYLQSLRNINANILDDNNATIKKEQIEKQIQDKNHQIDTLIEKLSRSSDKSLDDLIFDKLKFLRDETVKLNTELNSIIDNIQTSKSQLLNIEFITKLLDKCQEIETLSREEQKKLIHGLIDVIYWYGDNNKLKIKFHGINNEEDFETITIDEDEFEQLSLKLFFRSPCMSCV